MVVGENRIRGTVKSVYQLNKDAMETEDETGNAIHMAQKTFFAPKGKNYYPKYPTRGGDFSTMYQK